MPVPAEFEDDDAGSDIARDRHARIVRRMAYPLLALAAAGAIAVFGGGCSEEQADADWARVEGGLPAGEVIPDEAWSAAAREEADALRFTVHVPDGTDWEGGVLADGGLRLEGRGYVSTPTEHGPDFTLAYEYRFPDADSMPEDERETCNTGCLLFITGEDKVWPRCLEVQGRWDDTAQIKSNARDVQVTATLDEPARDAARKPPGEWNRVEIVSRGGALSVSLNGVQVATSEPTELTRGRIGFQAEGFPVEFRGVTIAE